MKCHHPDRMQFPKGGRGFPVPLSHALRPHRSPFSGFSRSGCQFPGSFSKPATSPTRRRLCPGRDTPPPCSPNVPNKAVQPFVMVALAYCFLRFANNACQNIWRQKNVQTSGQNVKPEISKLDINSIPIRK